MNSNVFSQKFVFAVCQIFSWILPSCAVGCYECSVFAGGRPTSCPDVMEKEECVACLKTYTKLRIHNRWQDYTYAEHISKTCVEYDLFKEPDGCTKQKTVGGYITRCFCSTDFCNHSSQTTCNRRMLVVVLMTLYLTLFFR